MKRFLAIAALSIASSACPASATAPKHPQKAAPKQAGKATPKASASQGTTPYASRAEALRFADDLAARRGLDREWVRQAIGQARFLPRVPQLMLPPPKGQAKNWNAYRSRFVEPVRIRAGLRFWQENAATLARAEQQYGVPAEIIVGIIGVETIYGQHMGGFRVMDALATLAFDFPAAHPRAAERQAFFQRELEQFLSLCDRTGMDPFAPRGSYAGAMGMPQFMPSSWARWAVDFDAQRLQLDTLLAPDILPSFSPASMADKGVLPLGAGAQHPGQLALVELQNGGDAPVYVAGTENFYVVTRYNWSSYYALAVIELGQAVAAARDNAR